MARETIALIYKLRNNLLYIIFNNLYIGYLYIYSYTIPDMSSMHFNDIHSQSPPLHPSNFLSNLSFSQVSLLLSRMFNDLLSQIGGTCISKGMGFVYRTVGNLAVIPSLKKNDFPSLINCQ